jgi:hypothetical protein
VAGAARSRVRMRSLTDNDAIDRERDRARRHRPSLLGRVNGSVPVHGDAERGERNGGRGPEQTGEAFGTQHFSQHRERQDHDAPDQEADDVPSGLLPEFRQRAAVP